jgi:hypothetical protein
VYEKNWPEFTFEELADLARKWADAAGYQIDMEHKNAVNALFSCFSEAFRRAQRTTLEPDELERLRDMVGCSHDCRKDMDKCLCDTATLWRKLDKAVRTARKKKPVAGPMNRSGYKKLIDEDIEWLGRVKITKSLEAEHIEVVLNSSVDLYYGIQASGMSPSQRREKQARMDKLIEALATDICSSISEGGQTYDECTADEQDGFRRAAHDILIRGVGKYFFLESKGD